LQLLDVKFMQVLGRSKLKTLIHPDDGVVQVGRSTAFWPRLENFSCDPCWFVFIFKEAIFKHHVEEVVDFC
jgi:hypothetical protein